MSNKYQTSTYLNDEEKLLCSDYNFYSGDAQWWADRLIKNRQEIEFLKSKLNQNNSWNKEFDHSSSNK